MSLSDIEQAQYRNLRYHFNKLIDEVLGPGYWNEGMDVYECDRITCEDIAYKAKRSVLEHLIDKWVYRYE
jgi:hypothetical protein